MKFDYDTAVKVLARNGFKPGCLLKAKSKKSFWKDNGPPTLFITKELGSPNHEWVRGKDIATVSKGALLLYLGLLDRDVRLDKESENKLSMENYKEYKVMCFLHGQEILWWDFVSIWNSGEAPMLYEKFEIIHSDKRTEKETDNR